MLFLWVYTPYLPPFIQGISHVSIICPAIPDENYDRFQNELIELLRIPSISHASEYKAEVDKAAEWLADKLRTMGVDNVEILPTAGHSVVYGDWLHGGDSAPTVLVYGHYDVQSPEPLGDWKSQPFEPDIRNDNLYARGASDMKGQTLASLNAVEAIIKTDDVPINIKFVLEEKRSAPCI